MKTWYDAASPWKKRIRFEDREFARMMDDLRERACQFTHEPGRGIDIDLVLLKGLGIEPDYVPLPDGVMGRTLFRADGSASVEVSRELLELAEQDSVQRRRLRSTLAHECGHVACHSLLHLKDIETGDLFPAAGNSVTAEVPSVLCRQIAVDQPGYQGEWWEYQANRCMAELLLPRRLFEKELATALNACSYSSIEDAARERDSGAITTALADEFDVSLTMVIYRLQELGFIRNGLQLQMGLAG